MERQSYLIMTKSQYYLLPVVPEKHEMTPDKVYRTLPEDAEGVWKMIPDGLWYSSVQIIPG